LPETGDEPVKGVVMKKLMLSMLAMAAMASGGSAFAQQGGAECNSGIAWGANPGCGDPTAPPANAQVWPGQRAPYFDPRIGYYDPRVYAPTDRVHRRAAPVVQPSRRDRDGDGVRNRDDRYPDDPRRY
jgi:hypothetical protein